MTDASSSIELEEFEQIEAAPGRALLRVALRSFGGSEVAGSPTLVIDAGGRAHRLAPLPAPADPVGLLRAAFSAPVRLLEPGARFSLELSDGSVLDLPTPSVRSRRAARRAEQTELRGRLRALEERLDGLVAELAEARSARASAEEAVAQLRAELERRTAEARAIARSFEEEAAARLQMEAVADELRSRLAAAGESSGETAELDP